MLAGSPSVTAYLIGDLAKDLLNFIIRKEIYRKGSP